MVKLYLTNRNINSSIPILVLVLLLVSSQLLTGQVMVPFNQRTSIYSPEKKIYNIKGDFQMIGNINLTLKNYTDYLPNSNNEMIYVDVDNDPVTINSSSATFKFSEENGALPECSNIIYAGLYWTGRAHDMGESKDSWRVNAHNQNQYNEETKTGYTLYITNNKGNQHDNEYTTTYTFVPDN